MSPETTPRARRNRKTRRAAILGERFASAAITAGGIGTILAVCLIFFFLAWVVHPIFLSPTVQAGDELSGAAVAEVDRAPWSMGVDEDRLLAWTLQHDGALELVDLATGLRLSVQRPFGDESPTAASFGIGTGERAAFGFADGSVRVARIEFLADFLKDDEVSEDVIGLEVGASAVHEGGVVGRTPTGQLRLTTLSVEVLERYELGTDAPVVDIDHAESPAGFFLTTLQEDGKFVVARVRERRNLMTGKTTRSLVQTVLRESADPLLEAPREILMDGLGQSVYAVWKDGRLEHWDMRVFDAPVLREELSLLEEGELARVRFVTGKKTLAVADDRGNLWTWFPARVGGEDSDPTLRLARRFEPGDSAVVALQPSPRSRTLAVSYASGLTRLFQTTLGDKLVELECEEVLTTLVIPPKEDALLGRSSQRLWTWEIEKRYPEATLTALFRPIPYEGFAEPEHFWASSSASDDFEPQLGLMPLVFGTIKATVYSMIFGAPLAILAAIYTSEFLSKRLRASVKSTVELMASLPSVVLGFIAALVLAPLVQDILPAFLSAFLTVPFAILTGAYLWQMLPDHLAIRWAGWQRFLAIFLTLPLGVGAAVVVGPLFESLLFAGEVEGWLDGRIGSAFGGTFFLLVPAAALVTVLLMGSVLGPRMRERSATWTRAQVARFESLKFVGGTLVLIAVAAVLAFLLQAAGFDPRGGVLDTYVQRNALIVGFAMGFAIVPIIYTLAEDALSEVPSQLREGSLAAGATTWQTAVRIVIPFAMSGIFSALMIGLGRAVGETMIVLMAAGNTAIMDWNVFNGFRTLSANVAVELPEAVVGSAHYRTLFVAALVLFFMTFALNTLAEMVRRHFRGRMHAL